MGALCSRSASAPEADSKPEKPEEGAAAPTPAEARVQAIEAEEAEDPRLRVACPVDRKKEDETLEEKFPPEFNEALQSSVAKHAGVESFPTAHMRWAAYLEWLAARRWSELQGDAPSAEPRSNAPHFGEADSPFSAGVVGDQRFPHIVTCRTSKDATWLFQVFTDAFPDRTIVRM